MGGPGGAHAQVWTKSMTDELDSLVARRVFVFIDKIPPGAIILPTMFVFKVKADGRHKSSDKIGRAHV